MRWCGKGDVTVLLGGGAGDFKQSGPESLAEPCSCSFESPELYMFICLSKWS